MNYAKQFNRKKTPETCPIPGTSQQANNGGGFSFAVDDWTQLDRFLILGAEGGTYYVKERKLIEDNHDATVRCIKQDGRRVVERAVEISLEGRAAKNDPAIFVLALVATYGDVQAKRCAFHSLPDVCRTGTHLFHFAEYCNKMRGWGRGLRSAVANWYLLKSAHDVAYQAVKYRQRDGWTHRDLLRLCHAKASWPELNAVLAWIVGKEQEGVALPPIIAAFEQVQKATTPHEVAHLVREAKLPWEAVPTQFLNSADVWEALLPHMGLSAIIRQLPKLTSIGLIAPFSEASRFVREKLANVDELKKARIHPYAALVAQYVYAQGHGFKGNQTWSPDVSVIDALDQAFYLSFGNVTPSGKRLVLALDVSSSMTWDSAKINGGPLTAREASAAMALVTAATEPETHIMAFSSGLVRLNISPRMRLNDVLRQVNELPGSATDCSLPIRWAIQDKIPADGFVVYTDSECNCGPIHASQALKQFRNQVNPKAKSVVVGMVSNGFSIADPQDSGMLDVVGFDAASPALIADFFRS